MLNIISKYNEKTRKMLRFCKKFVYPNINPKKIARELPDNFLSDTSYSKKKIITDVYKLNECCKRISFVYGFKKKGDELEEALNQFDTSYCNIPVICPICGEKVGRARREKYKDKILECAENYKYTYMITLTVKDEVSFDDSYRSLRDTARAFLMGGRLRGSYEKNGVTVKKFSNGEPAKIGAMLGSIEVKKGKNSGMFHTHMHCLAFTNEMLDYSIYDQEKKNKLIKDIKESCHRSPRKEELSSAIKEYAKWKYVDEYGEIKNKTVPVSKFSKEWLKASKGWSINISVKVLPGDPEKIAKQSIEVLKYTSKVSDFSQEDAIELIANRKNKRLFSTYGDFYDMDLEDAKRKRAEGKEKKAINDYLQLNGIENMGDQEEKFYLHQLYSFVYSRKHRKLIEVQEVDKEMIKEKFLNKGRLVEAQTNIMKAYYMKESLVKDIMKVYLKEKKKQGSKMNPDYKLNIIKMIDDLDLSYTITKRKLYKHYMRRRPSKYDKVFNPSPVQKRFLVQAKKLFKKII